MTWFIYSAINQFIENCILCIIATERTTAWIRSLLSFIAKYADIDRVPIYLNIYVKMFIWGIGILAILINLLCLTLTSSAVVLKVYGCNYRHTTKNLFF